MSYWKHFIALLAVAGYSLQAAVDQGCAAASPSRAADGTCQKSYDDSEMTIPAFCSSFQRNYQCAENNCTESYAKCLEYGKINIENRTKCEDK